MKIERDIERKIRQKEEEIAKLQTELDRAVAFVDGLKESLKMIQRTSGDGTAGDLRPGSQLHKTREILIEEGKPLHVAEILRRIGREVSKNSKVSLSGSLGLYVRNNEVFTRPAPNTFGLIEFGEIDNNVKSQTPLGFGSDDN